MQEKRITTYIKSLKLRNEYNGYNLSYFLSFINSEKNIWISEEIDQFAGTLNVIQRFATQKITNSSLLKSQAHRMILKNQVYRHLNPE